MLSLTSSPAEDDSIKQFTYSEFVVAVDAGQVATASVLPDGAVSGELDTGLTYESRIPVELAGQEFLDRLEAASVEVEAVADEPSLLGERVRLVLCVPPDPADYRVLGVPLPPSQRCA